MLRRLLRRAALAAVALGATLAAALAVWAALPLPPTMLAAPSTGLRIEDRHGAVLRSTRAADGSRARWMPLAAMDSDLLLAFVATEDKRFWSHHGVDPVAVARAAVANVRAGRVVSGASSIPMQLARLLRPGHGGWGGKVREALWAVRLDAQLSKEMLLEQYLNRVHLGQGAIGVAAATDLYFDASASEVSVGEAAMLAGLAQAPSRHNPISDPRAAVARRRVALERMRRASMIAEAERERASAEPALASRSATPFLAPHFTTRLIQGDAGSTDGSGDRVWRSTLDASLQAEVELEVRHAVEQLRSRNVRHGAAVVLDNASGDVLAWVGSPDFWEQRSGQTDMVTSPRQPGSALKPFLYALAFDRGVTAATVLADVPLAFATVTGAYAPRNYDRRFRGPVRAREALASSYNVPAVALAERVSVGALHATLRRAGFTTLTREPDHYGLGLALGNGDVTLLELANAYRALANGGVWRPWRALVGRAGVAADEARVVSPAAAALVLDVLADPSARVPGFGASALFQFPFPTAVKTGTSRHFTDNWAVATTGSFTVAVWVGNFSGQPMQGVSGISGAGPLLQRVVMLTAERVPPGLLVTPDQLGFESVEICRVSGLLATPRCGGTREWFIPGSAPQRADDWVIAGRVRLPDEYAAWTAGESGSVWPTSSEDAEWPDPSAAHERNADPDSARPLPQGFRVVSPQDGDVLRIPPGVPARFASIGLRSAGGSGQIRWFVNGEPVEGSRWRLAPGEYVVTAEGASGARAQARVRVE